MTIHQEIEGLEARLAEVSDADMQAEIIMDILAKHVRIRSTEGHAGTHPAFLRHSGKCISIVVA